MKGAAAAKLAQKGFTSAPAITLEEAHKYWVDIGRRWYVGEQYYEPYPVCRWAQAHVEGARIVGASAEVYLLPEARGRLLATRLLVIVAQWLGH